MGARWRLLALAGLFTLVSACAGNPDGDDQVASLSTGAASGEGDAQAGDGKTDEDKIREFAGCMREHGVDLPDPEPGTGGGVRFRAGGPGADKAKLEAAHTACKSLLPNGGNPEPLDAEQLDRLREHAKCLREHGLNVPDPDPGNPGIAISVDGVDKEKADAAMKACEGLLPDGGKVAAGAGKATGGGPESPK